MPGNERADALAEKAAEKVEWSATTSLAHMKLRLSEKFRRSKEKWDEDPRHHGTEEALPRPKKSCMDWAKTAMAWTATQIRTALGAP
jgi:hypothetical protein